MKMLELKTIQEKKEKLNVQLGQQKEIAVQIEKNIATLNQKYTETIARLNNLQGGIKALDDLEKEITGEETPEKKK